MVAPKNEPVEVEMTAPTDDSVTLDTRAGSARVLANGQPQLVYLLVEARASEKAPEVLPLNLALVVDTSASMDRQKRLDNAVRGVHQALARMTDRDVCAVVVFSAGARTVLHTPVSLDFRALDGLLRKTPVGEGTNLFTGLQAAVAEVQTNLSPERLNHVVMLTDGETDGEGECRAICDAGYRQGISFSAIGLGSSCNAKLLDELSERHNGRFYAVSDAQALPSIYDRELKGVREVVVRNNRLVLTPEPGTRVRRAYRILPRTKDLGEPSPVNGEIVLPMGDLSRADTLSVLFEVSVVGKSNGKKRVATARVEHDGVQGAASHPLEITFTSNRSQLGGHDPRVEEAITRAHR